MVLRRARMASDIRSRQCAVSVSPPPHKFANFLKPLAARAAVPNVISEARGARASHSTSSFVQACAESSWRKPLAAPLDRASA
jgi:hypothetical protein